MCSCCGEPWSKHASNHQPGCSGGTAMFVPDVRQLEVVSPKRAANSAAPSLAKRFAMVGGRR